MTIMHHGSVAAASGVIIVCTVGLGADKTENDIDVSAPIDSRAGYRLNFGTGQQQTGNSPTAGGPITTWANDGDALSPDSCGHALFEISWTEISDDGVNSKTSPFAADAFNTWDNTKTWFAARTANGLRTWVIDVTVREIADVSNTDTVRITMNVEGDTL